MLGRQAGFFLILACQDRTQNTLTTESVTSFISRVALGHMSEMGYGMMFGSDGKRISSQNKSRAWLC